MMSPGSCAATRASQFSSAGHIILATAPVSRFHFDSSLTSCFLPAAVSAVVLVLPFHVFACWLPFPGYPAIALQSMERRVEGPVLDLQQIVSGPLYMLRDLMAVSRAEQESAKDQHVEGPLE